MNNEPANPSFTGPKVYVSYAWGDDSSEEAKQRGLVVDRLCESVQAEGWEVIRDKNVLKLGDLISTFMRTLGQADLVIVVLSAKYMRSIACMTELHSIYRNSRQEKQEFLNRIIPLVLSDARISTWRDRAEHARHWESEFNEMSPNVSLMGVRDLELYHAIRAWRNEVGDILDHVNDMVHLHGFDAIVKDDFAALRQILRHITTSESPEVVKNIAGEWLEVKQRSNFERPCSLITFTRGNKDQLSIRGCSYDVHGKVRVRWPLENDKINLSSVNGSEVVHAYTAQFSDDESDGIDPTGFLYFGFPLPENT
jgi:hypothetical protein